MTKFYHGSPEDNVTEILRPTPENQFVFYGMFFGDEEVARSHGGHIYSVEVDEDNLADAKGFAYDDDAYEAIKAAFGEPLQDEELFHDLVSQCVDIHDVEISDEERNRLNEVFGSVLGYFPGTDNDELGWAFQSAASFIAEKLGYEGVWVPDEHGMSLMVTPGHKLHKEL